ncbi:MAG: hypothetical protein DWQ05_06800 [Calditrichaeota bacterium]|nr:MAG: hypothetical protein DWQ05_06800 [Calditrichota bacterium]
MSWDQLKRDFFSVGLKGILIDLVIRFVNLFTYFKVLHCLAIEEAVLHHEIKELNLQYQDKFLSSDEVDKYVHIETTRLPDYVAEDGINKKDECLGLLDNGNLINYCWYSDLPTRLCANLEIHFSADYKYAYRSFTIVPFRGQRLQGLNLYRALKYYQKKGYKGVVAYVDSNNFNSLRSLNHLGFQIFERVMIIKFWKTYYIFKPRTKSPYEFEIHLTPDAKKHLRLKKMIRDAQK